MDKIAILIAGWHYPKKFYEQMADLSVPIGYEFDYFVVTHRDIDLPIVHEEKLEVLKRIDEKTLFGKMDYELYSEKPSKEYFESLGFEIIEAENNYGDYQYVNQWLEIYDYKNYEYVCYIHDDTYITDYELVTDIVEGKCELYYHDNREALANYNNWLMVYNTNADRSPVPRGSFYFFKQRFFDKVANRFDMGEKYSKVLLDRTDKIDTPTSITGTADWNTIARYLNVMFQEKGIRDLAVKLGKQYRMSKYMVEGERGFMSKVIG